MLLTWNNQRELSFSLVVKQLSTLRSHWQKAGVTILGTQVADLDRAEDRDLFEQALKDLDIPQPPGQTATNEEEAVLAARKIGFPVLVRPSYVLGGRAMEIVENEEDLRSYMRTAVKASPDHPVLVDSYIVGQECEVDAIQTEKMSLSLVSWSISNVQVFTQVTQWPYTLHKPCRKRCKKQSQTILNA